MVGAEFFHYQVYGLKVSSEFEIQELSERDDDEEADVVVRFGDLGLITDEAKVSFEFYDDRQVVVLPAVGAFVILDSDTVLVEPKPGVGEDFLAVPLLGPVLAILLHLKGMFVLHGSAVIHDGKAFGFVGDKGAGKSTLAAMLIKNDDVDFLTDDLLVVSNELDVWCGYSQLKLSDEALSYSNRDLGRVRPPPIEQFPKNQFLLKKQTAAAKVPIGGIFELIRGEDAKIEDVSLGTAIRLLLRFSYISRFTERELDAAERQHLFSFASNIAATGKVNRLSVPGRIKELDEIIKILD